MSLREKYDKWRFAQNDRRVLDKEELDVVRNPGRLDGGAWWAQARTTYGDLTEWYELLDFVTNTSFTVDANYALAKEKMDVDNMIDLLVHGVYAAHTDWISIVSPV